MAYQGRYNSGADKGGSKRRGSKGNGGTAWKIVLAVVLTFVLTLGLLAGAVLWYVNTKLGKVNQATFEDKDVSGQDLSGLIGNLDETAPPQVDNTVPATEPPTEPPTEAPTEPDYGQTGKVVNILVVGQDYRQGEAHKLADCIMLLTLNKETHTLVLTSFLRDSYVKLSNYAGHSCGWNRINTAYALGYSWRGDAGAMEMLNETLEENYGVKVDGNVEFSFETFIRVIDAIGGVEVELYGDELDYLMDMLNRYKAQYNLTIEPGDPEYERTNIHEGTCTLYDNFALEYVRARHVNAGDNDMNRTMRQQKALSQVLKKLQALSPLELNSLIDQVLGEITTNISADDLKVYIQELTPYLFDLNLVSNQIPVYGTYKGEMKELPDGLSGVLVNYNFQKNKDIMAAVQAGELPPTE